MQDLTFETINSSTDLLNNNSHLLLSAEPNESSADRGVRLQKLRQKNVSDAIQRYNVNYGDNFPYKLNRLISPYPTEGEESDREFAEITALSFSIELIKKLFEDICIQNGFSPDQKNIVIQAGSSDRTAFTLLDTRDFGRGVDFRIYIPPTIIHKIIRDVSEVVGRIYSSKANESKFGGLDIEQRRTLIMKSLKFFYDVDISSDSLTDSLLLPFELDTGYSHSLQSSCTLDLINLAEGLAHEVQHIRQALDTPEAFEQTATATANLRDIKETGSPLEGLKKAGEYSGDEGEKKSKVAEVNFLTFLRNRLSDTLAALGDKSEIEYVRELYESKKVALDVITREIKYLREQYKMGSIN